MNSTKTINNKILSIQNTKKITKAMEMVAASKMRKNKKNIEYSYYYTKNIFKIINNFTLNNLNYKHPYLNKRNIKCIGYLIISTDRGLVGGLNINLFKKILINIKKLNKKNIKVKIFLIGSKAFQFFNLFNIKIISKIENIGDKPKLTKIIKLIKIIISLYNEGKLDKIYIANNIFINTLSQTPQIKQILPLLFLKKINKKNICYNYIYESNSIKTINIILNMYIESQIYKNIIENLLSEQAARMIAMKSATENANSLIKELKLIYNKIRQTNITQEIAEIFSGII
ncbi:MAG: ATP synthase F1 subunit gamma [gamma proteobacterium endosymbiont of Trioza apicalis]